MQNKRTIKKIKDSINIKKKDSETHIRTKRRRKV